MDWALADLAGSEDAKNVARHLTHGIDKRTSEGEENFHGGGDCKSDLLATFQGQGLWDQFAEDHVEAGDQTESDDQGDTVGVNRGVGNLIYKAEAFNDAADDGFADPAEGQADDGDAELNAVDDFVEVAVQLLDNAGTDAAGFDELLDAGLANADQGEFGGGEERIGCDQQQDKKHLQQHVGKHRLGNSNIPKEVLHFYGK